MERRRLLSLSGMLAAATLAGCAGPAEAPTTTGTPAGTTPDTPTPEPPTGEPSVDDERLTELVAGNAAFALDLHDHLAGADGGNQFVSPYSISVALAMTYAGARGNTATAMAETLRYTLGEEVHPAFADLEAVLESRETATDPMDGEPVEAVRLDVANALWGREGFEFAVEFLALLEAHYGGGLRRADFAGDPAGERERINAWVADATEDRIEDLLPQGAIGPSTVLVLTNAIYFLAGWAFPFDPEDTTDGAFTAADGSRSTVPFMRGNLKTNYASVAGTEVLELPYVGRDVSMVLLLPPAGEFRRFERKLTADRLFGLFDALEAASGDVALPRFEYSTAVQLSDALSALGMPEAFGPGADFGGMVPGDDAGLFIDEVYHEAFVSVDEEGTEAAAATAVVVVESAPGVSFDLTFDRPFLFCVRDRPTDAVLFLGRVVDAGQAQG